MRTLVLCLAGLAIILVGLFLWGLWLAPGRSSAAPVVLAPVEAGRLRVEIVVPDRRSTRLDGIHDDLVRELGGVSSADDVTSSQEHWNWLWGGRGRVIVDCPLPTGLDDAAVKGLIATQIYGRLGADAKGAGVILERRGTEPDAPVFREYLIWNGRDPQWIGRKHQVR